MGAVLKWLVTTAISVVKWSVANPLKAAAVATVAKLSSNYIRKQPWAGSTLVANMLQGVSQIYGWPAGISIGARELHKGAGRAADYVIRLARDRLGTETPYYWLLRALLPPPLIGKLSL